MKNYIIYLKSGESYDNIYIKSEKDDFYYLLPGGDFQDEVLGASWLDDHYFVMKKFSNYFVGDIQGKLAPLESTKIWSSKTQTDAQLPYRHGDNWTDETLPM